MKIKNNIFNKSQNLNNFLIPLIFLFVFILVFLNKTDSMIAKKIKNTSFDVIAPLSYIISLPINKIQQGINIIYNFKLLDKENDRLKEEVRRLKQWQTLSMRLVDENEAYKRLLNVEDSSLELKYTVKVMSRSPNSFMNSIQLSAGTNKNIKQNSSIINERGLVGRIIDVGKFTSRALLINDINSNIPVKVLNRDIFAIATGHTSNKLLILKFIKENKNLKVGQLLVTSGNAGLFPRNIAVGKVFKILDSKIYVRPFVDFDNLQFVQVVSAKNK